MANDSNSSRIVENEYHSITIELLGDSANDSSTVEQLEEYLVKLKAKNFGPKAIIRIFGPTANARAKLSASKNV